LRRLIRVWIKIQIGKWLKAY